MRFRGTLFEPKSCYGTVIEGTFDVPWTEEGVLSVFPGVVVPAKGSQLWGYADYIEGSRRGSSGINVVNGVVLDKDCGDVGELARVQAHLDAQGLAYIVYSSWSHRNPEKAPNDLPSMVQEFDCFRVVIPYAVPVTKEYHTACVPLLFGYEVPEDPESYLKEVDGVYVVMDSGKKRQARPRGWDPCSSKPAQAWYPPECPPEREKHMVLEVRQGRPIDVDEVLKRNGKNGHITPWRPKTYKPATELAEGALRFLDKKLRDAGFGLRAPGYSGWARSTCPSCQDRSPSLTVRANGDGIEVHCHASCSRHDVLSALGCEGLDLLQEPSELEEKYAEQLDRQTPQQEAVEVADAVAILREDLREALDSKEPTVLESPAGTGKSYASSQVIAERVRAGLRVAYATQEHAVAHETRSKLPIDVRGKSVHLHSPLVQVGGGPVCQRADEVRAQVFDYGVSLKGKICPRCPHQFTCEAKARSDEAAQAAEEAPVVFVSHAGIHQVIGTDKGEDFELIVDEMPSAFEEVSVSAEDMQEAAKGLVLPSAARAGGAVVQAIAQAWIEGKEPTTVELFDHTGTVEETVMEWGGRLPIRSGTTPRPDETRWLEVADSIIRLYWNDQEGGKSEGDPGKTELVAMIPDACHQALVGRNGVLLSATPMVAALPEFNFKRQTVTDGAPVRRVQILTKNRGSTYLTKCFWDWEMAEWKGDHELLAGSGVPWPIVDEALARAREEAKQYACKRVLFVTFKALADQLRNMPERIGTDIEIGHYGALRGKNDWQVGAEKEVSVVYCFGAPRGNLMPTLRHLGLTSTGAEEAWTAHAAGELTQAEGRLRLPRRTKPCSVIVEGDVAPLSWHQGNVSEVVVLERQPSPLEQAMFWHSKLELEAALGMELDAPGLVKTPEAALEKLANTERSFDKLRNLPAKRKELLAILGGSC